MEGKFPSSSKTPPEPLDARKSTKPRVHCAMQTLGLTPLSVSKKWQWRACTASSSCSSFTTSPTLTLEAPWLSISTYVRACEASIRRTKGVREIQAAGQIVAVKHEGRKMLLVRCSDESKHCGVVVSPRRSQSPVSCAKSVAAFYFFFFFSQQPHHCVLSWWYLQNPPPGQPNYRLTANLFCSRKKKEKEVC